MEQVARGADGRRLFTAEFKRQQIDRILRGEATASEVSRELGVARSLIQRWKHLATRGAEAAVGSNQEVVPASELRGAQQRIRELERLLGKKEVELEILRAAREEVKKGRAGTACPGPHAATGRDDLPDVGDRAGHGVPRVAWSSPALSSPGG